MKKLSCALFLIMLTLPCHAHMYLEKTYQDKWCKAQNGQTEVILYDKARVDCVTNTHAIEFDFAQKWGESIGQALYYSTITGKLAGIVLIMENPSGDQKYLNRVNAVAKHHGITVWTMTPADLCLNPTTNSVRMK